MYRPDLCDHFVITSFTSGWQKEERAGCFAPGLLCAIVKWCEEYNKDSPDTEMKVRYEGKKSLTTCPCKLSLGA